MAQNEKFEEMVNRVDREARQFASFDDYLASKDEGGSEWNKNDANGAAVSSSPSSSEKADAKVESSPLPNAEPASEPAKEEPQETPEEIAARKARELEERKAEIEKASKVEQLSHPTAPNVTAEPTQAPPVQVAPETTTRLVLNTVPWAGTDATYLSEVTEVDTTEPDWWKEVFHSGRKFAVEAAELDDVVKHYHKLEEAMKKIRCAQLGTRAGLEMRLQGAGEEKRGKLRELDKEYRSKANAPAAARMKSERAPKAKKGAGIELADTLGGAMGLEYDMIIAKLKKAGKLDEATQEYVDKTYPKVGE